ncbi:MAG TPA: hypothetical protein VGN64_16690 [Dyadobacter sp.]|nr:hypothetical protein [Dyadobacter sp.]
MKNVFKKVLWTIMIFLMAGMPVVRTIDTGLGLHQLAGHKSALAGDFWFPNPWKYRVFSTWLVETSYQIYTHTVDKIIPVDGLINFTSPVNSARFALTADLKRFSANGAEVVTPEYFVGQDKTGRDKWEVIKEYHRYFVVFMLLRFCIDLAILYCAYKFYQLFIRNFWMQVMGVLFLANGINNAFRDTAFGFDTYIDLLLFLISAIIVIKNYAPVWLIPVMVIGILNRETSLMIPVIFATVNFARDNYKITLRNFGYAAGLGLIGVIGFVGLRLYYGYEPYMLTSGWYRVVENFSNYSIISGQFAIMLVLPFLSLFFLRQAPVLLRTIWITIVPVWFAIHYWSFPVLESRYFLVPFALAIIPVTLWGIEKTYQHEERVSTI